MNSLYLETMFFAMDEQDFRTFKRNLQRRKITIKGFSNYDRLNPKVIAISICKSPGLLQVYEDIISLYWPGTPIKQIDSILNSEMDYEKAAGYLAIYASKGLEDSDEAKNLCDYIKNSLDIKKENIEVDESVVDTIVDDDPKEIDLQDTDKSEKISLPNPLESTSSQVAMEINSDFETSSELKEETVPLYENFYPLSDEELHKQRKNTIAIDKTRYIGFISVQNSNSNYSFYNFYPIAKLSSDGKLNVIEAPRNDFPTYGNINIYGAGNVKYNLITGSFNDGIFYALQFDAEDVEDNTPNKTQLKVNIDSIAKNERCEIGMVGLYIVVTPEDDNELIEQKVVRVNGDGLRVGENVLLLYKDMLLGPFPLKYNSAAQIYTVNTKLTENKYILKAYRAKKGNVRDYLENIEYFDPSQTNNVVNSFVYLNDDFFEQGYVDFIDEKTLLESYVKYNSKKTVNTNDPDGVSEYLSSSLSNFASYSEEITDARRSKIQRFLTDTENLTRFSDDLAQALSSILVGLMNNEKGFADELINKLSSNENFMSHIQRYNIISERIESLRMSLQVLNETYDEQKKAQQSQIDKELGDKQKELDKTKQALDSLIDELNVAAHTKNILDAKIVLEAKCDELKDNEKNLKKNIEVLEKQINTVTERLTNVANNVDTAFDPFISNKLIEAAESYNRKMDEDILLSRVKDYDDCFNNRQDELSESELKQYLYEEFKYYRKSDGYSYDDVMNYMICLTQGFITVFAGAPGTGKTSTCNIIAHILGLDSFDDLYSSDSGVSLNRYVPVSVERGWTSKRDMIGYYNPLGKCFNASNIRLYNAFRIMDSEKKALDKKKKGNTTVSLQNGFPYIVMLDEANLSPMEYYWADFMNLCDGLDGHETVNLGENLDFMVSDNLRFLATMNNDHTTEILSPRFIDRAWIISVGGSSDEKLGNPEFRKVDRIITSDELKRVFMPIEKNNLYEDANVSEMWKYIVKEFTQQGVSISPRVRLAVNNYWSTASSVFMGDSDVDPSIKALDYAIDQRVLPKINGNGAAFRSFLDGMSKYCVRNNLTRCNNTITRIIKEGDIHMEYYQYF